MKKPLPDLLAIRLPANVDRAKVNAALAEIARANGFISNNAPKKGSIGHMLHALATGKATITNLDPKEK